MLPERHNARTEDPAARVGAFSDRMIVVNMTIMVLDRWPETSRSIEPE
jgi:uncharacterized membrane protein